jgi:hypothetical protein
MVPAVGDPLFYHGKRPGPGQCVGIPGPAENLDGDIGADGGAQRAADALLWFPDDGAAITGFTLLLLKAQQFPLASGRAEAAALAPFSINFNPGNHSLLLKELLSDSRRLTAKSAVTPTNGLHNPPAGMSQSGARERSAEKPGKIITT